MVSVKRQAGDEDRLFAAGVIWSVVGLATTAITGDGYSHNSWHHALFLPALLVFGLPLLIGASITCLCLVAKGLPFRLEIQRRDRQLEYERLVKRNQELERQHGIGE